MAQINISTAGIKLMYCVETTAGTRPTTLADYTEIEGIISIPAIDSTPDTLETTTLNNTEFKSYIAGLKDVGGSLEFTFNKSDDLDTKWNALIEAYETGIATQKRTWFVVYTDKLVNSFFFEGEPSSLGLSEVTVNSVLGQMAYITPGEIAGWLTKLS